MQNYHSFSKWRTGAQSIIKAFNESRTVQNKPDRGRKRKTLQRKLVRDVSKNKPQNHCQETSEWLKSGIVVSKKTITRTLCRNRLWGCRSRTTPLLQSRHYKGRLKYAKDNVEKDYPYWKFIFWSQTRPLWPHRHWLCRPYLIISTSILMNSLLNVSSHV